LFAAGMSLLDTTDGVMMVGAYNWAVADPLRKLHYNFTITLMSITVALFIGGIQLSNLAVRIFGWSGPTADFVVNLNLNFDVLGIAIIALFAAAWVLHHHIQIVRGSQLARPAGEDRTQALRSLCSLGRRRLWRTSKTVLAYAALAGLTKFAGTNRREHRPSSARTLTTGRSAERRRR
jgi:hypothetical protein